MAASLHCATELCQLSTTIMALCDPLPLRLASMPTGATTINTINPGITSSSNTKRSRSSRRWRVSPHLLPLLLCTLVYFFLLYAPQPGTCDGYYDEASKGIVRISHKNFTALNNRNLTITCKVDLKSHLNQSKSISFTTNSRMVLTFMTVPRLLIPLDQIQSFLHCHDPQRTSCWAEFNQDLSCLEDKMNFTYYNKPTYLVEAVCQVDDRHVCNRDWLDRYPLDCWDSGYITVVQAPKLNHKCVDIYANKTQQCGENQYCDVRTSLCQCLKGFYPDLDHQCISAKGEDAYELKMTENPKPSTYTAIIVNESESTENESGPEVVNKADSKGTFKAIVIFLLVVAILLCIALGIVIIWSRNARRMLEELSH